MPNCVGCTVFMEGVSTQRHSDILKCLPTLQKSGTQAAIRWWYGRLAWLSSQAFGQELHQFQTGSEQTNTCHPHLSVFQTPFFSLCLGQPPECSCTLDLDCVHCWERNSLLICFIIRQWRIIYIKLRSEDKTVKLLVFQKRSGLHSDTATLESELLIKFFHILQNILKYFFPF